MSSIVTLFSYFEREYHQCISPLTLIYGSGYEDPWIVQADANFEVVASPAPGEWLVKIPERNYEDNRTLAFIIKCSKEDGCGDYVNTLNPYCKFFGGSNPAGFIETQYNDADKTIDVILAKNIDKEVVPLQCFLIPWTMDMKMVHFT